MHLTVQFLNHQTVKEQQKAADKTFPSRTDISVYTAQQKKRHAKR